MRGSQENRLNAGTQFKVMKWLDENRARLGRLTCPQIVGMVAKDTKVKVTADQVRRLLQTLGVSYINRPVTGAALENLGGTKAMRAVGNLRNQLSELRGGIAEDIIKRLDVLDANVQQLFDAFLNGRKEGLVWMDECEEFALPDWVEDPDYATVDGGSAGGEAGEGPEDPQHPHPAGRVG